MLTIDPESGRFISDGKPLGVVASKKRGRWYFHTVAGDLLASGMTPAGFAKSFWFRTDFEGDE